VTALDELTGAEAEELGPLLRAVTRALREVTGCDKTYVALFAESEGFAHAHFHVIPRHRGLDLHLRGPRVFNLLGADGGRSVPDAVMDEIALRIAAALTVRRETTGRPGS
jgi:diadenosine tetraphosphate (Ap4A) HIT family hydrolase